MDRSSVQVNLVVSGDAQGPRQEAEGLEGKVWVRVEKSRLVKRVSDSTELCNSLQKKFASRLCKLFLNLDLQSLTDTGEWFQPCGNRWRQTQILSLFDFYKANTWDILTRPWPSIRPLWKPVAKLDIKRDTRKFLAITFLLKGHISQLRKEICVCKRITWYQCLYNWDEFSCN